MAQGRGGKFSVVPLLLNVGSGLGLLAVVCSTLFYYLEQPIFTFILNLDIFSMLANVFDILY